MMTRFEKGDPDPHTEYMNELNHGLERNLDVSVIELMRHKKKRGVRLPFPTPTSIQAAKATVVQQDDNTRNAGRPGSNG